MSRDLVIGVDCSTTASKAIVWDMSGRAVATARRSYELDHVRSGWVEQHAPDWWTATAAGCCPFRGRLLNKSVRERGTAPNTSRSKRRRARAGPSDQSPSAPTPRRCPARRSRNHQGASSFGGPQDRHGVGACGGCWRFGALIWEAQPPGFWICAKFAAQTPTISSNPRRSNVGHDVTPVFSSSWR